MQDKISLISPFSNLLEIKECCENDKIWFEITPNQQHCNNSGILHGGVIMSILDIAMASAAKNARNCAAVTTNFNCNFIQAAKLEKLFAHSTIIKLTATMAFVESSLYNEQNNLFAKANASFTYLRKAIIKGN